MKTAFISFIAFTLLTSWSSAGIADYETEVFVPGSGMHGIHGLTFDSEDRLFVGSVVGQSIYEVRPDNGQHRTYIGAPGGMADDLEFGPDGTLYWTSVILGEIHAQKNQGPMRVIATGLPGINSIAFKQDGRLFATQVFQGDALHEIDPLGVKPPRKIIENMGGLNGFDFGPDGLLYGPLWFKGEVVKVDVDSGEMTTVATGFKIPAAVNFDSKGILWVLDTAKGHIVSIDPETGKKTVYVGHPTGMDNLAFDSNDELYFTVMTDNAVYHFDRETRESTPIRQSLLSVPGDLAIYADGDQETLYLADLFAIRSIDAETAEVRDMGRFPADNIEYPNGVAVGERFVHFSSWFTGTIQTVDRKTHEILKTYHDLPTAFDVVELDDGSLLALQMFTGTITRLTGTGADEREIVARGLTTPVSMVRSGPDSVYVTLFAKGQIVRVDLKTGEHTVVAEGLSGPEGLDLAPDGRIIVAETGIRSVSAIDPNTGEREVLAKDLPIGYQMPAGMPPMGGVTGIAVAQDGTIFVSSDIEDAIYTIRAR